MARCGVRLDDHPRTQEGLVDVVPQALHGARVLMAQDDRRVRLEVVVPDVDIRAADARIPHPHHHLAGARVAQLDLTQLQLGVPRRDLHESDHGWHATTTFMP